LWASLVQEAGWTMQIARCMSVGRGDSDEALTRPLAEMIGVG
jgi:hypothetical protein